MRRLRFTRRPDLVRALETAIEDAMTLAVLRMAAMSLNMPLADTTGNQFTAGLHQLLEAMGASGVSWGEAAKRITGESTPS